MKIEQLIDVISKRYNVTINARYELSSNDVYTNRFSLPFNGFYNIADRSITLVVNKVYSNSRLGLSNDMTAFEAYAELNGVEELIITILHEVGHCIDFDNTRIDKSVIAERYWSDRMFQIEKERMAWIYGFIVLKDLQLHKAYRHLIDAFFESINDSLYSYYRHHENGKQKTVEFAKLLKEVL